MFIVAGKRRVFPVKGYGAGFCHFCRDVRQLKLRELLVLLTLGLGVVGGAWTLWQLHRSAARLVARRLVPHLVRALAPLRPTSKEIDQVLATYLDRGDMFAKVLRADRLVESTGFDHVVDASLAAPITPR